MRFRGRFLPSLAGAAILWTALGAGLDGCAGYRGGWESFAYVGETLPQPPPVRRTPFEAFERSRLDLPGLQLRVTLHNQIRSYDRKVYLYLFPLTGDGRDVYSQSPAPGKTRVSLDVTPLEPGFAFRPALAVLRVAGERFRGVAGFEFGRWNTEGDRVADGGTWGYRPIGGGMPLSEARRRYLLSVDFDTPTPPPSSPDLALDLSEALHAASVPALPLVNFLPVRWRESYS